MGLHLKSPLVRVVVPIILGIVFYIHSGQAYLAGPAFVFLFVTYILLKFTPISYSWRWRWTTGLLLYGVLFLAGILLTDLHSHKTSISASVQEDLSKSSHAYVFKLLSEPERKKTTLRAVASIELCSDSALSLGIKGKMCLLYFQWDSIQHFPAEGDFIVAATSPDLIDPPSNPAEFNFRDYMARKGVWLSTYVKTGQWAVVGHESSFFKDLALRCRQYVYQRMALSGVKGQEYDLAASLLLGQKDGLERDVRDTFSRAGAMHILCVSGLHVGIIFVILNTLFKPLQRRKSGKLVHFLVVVGAIWLYALITAFSPSVMRASLMFSVLQAGKLMRNPPPTVNSLAASALILVILNPLIITNLGFQFSYLAVLSILFSMPLLQALWQPQNPLLNKAWSLILVSIAAQLGAGPIGMHYFHQFPVWFLLTNLMVIPLATIIMYLGVSVIAIPVDGIASLLGMMLSNCLKLLSVSVKFVEQIPGSVISSISLSGMDTVLVYSMLYLVVLLVYVKKKVFLFLLSLSILFFITSMTVNKMALLHQKGLYIYSIRDAFVMDLVDGRECMALVSADTIPVSSFEFSVEPNRISKGIRQVEMLGFDKDTLSGNGDLVKMGSFIGFHGLRVFITDDNTFLGPDKIVVDIIVITGEYRNSIERLISTINCEELVFHNSVPPWRLAEFKRECESFGMDYYSIAEQGCFMKRL